MTADQPKLLPDGRVFPPVTPDPPPPPGQEEIVVPDLVIGSGAEGQDESADEPADEPADEVHAGSEPPAGEPSA
ncbi:hypothetical protein [Intrasporangium sp. DVR]|uniref:hypothetical protein n=1 Tax=Intrasporangium sp. DVR TaxID=3127867 RepID=UPI00313A60F5